MPEGEVHSVVSPEGSTGDIQVFSNTRIALLEEWDHLINKVSLVLLVPLTTCSRGLRSIVPGLHVQAVNADYLEHPRVKPLGQGSDKGEVFILVKAPH